MERISLRMSVFSAGWGVEGGDGMAGGKREESVWGKAADELLIHSHLERISKTHVKATLQNEVGLEVKAPVPVPVSWFGLFC